MVVIIACFVVVSIGFSVVVFGFSVVDVRGASEVFTPRLLAVVVVGGGGGGGVALIVVPSSTFTSVSCPESSYYEEHSYDSHSI